MELKKSNALLDTALKAKTDSLLELQKEVPFQLHVLLLCNKFSQCIKIPKNVTAIHLHWVLECEILKRTVH